MKQTKRTRGKSAKRTAAKSARRTTAKSAKRTKRRKATHDFTMHSGVQIMRVLQERLIPGHWANADQLQRWLIEDEIAKLIHAGYLEKFGEDGVCLTEKGKTHKAPVLDISEPLAFEPAERDAEADDAAQHDLDVALRRVGQLPWPVLVAFLLGGQFADVAA